MSDEPNNETKLEATEKVVTPVIKKPVEIGGPTGPEPTRYGDWQFKGRVSDF